MWESHWRKYWYICVVGSWFFLVHGMGSLIWLESGSSSWAMKTLLLLTGPNLFRPKTNHAPLGHDVLLYCHIYPTQRRIPDCPGADWFLNPSLGGDAPGTHLSSHQKHAQMLYGVRTSMWRPCTQLNHFITRPAGICKSWISLIKTFAAYCGLDLESLSKLYCSKNEQFTYL